MNLDLQLIAMNIFNTCLANNIKLDVQWIPRTWNEQADFISRLIDPDDWGVSQQLVQLINDSRGPLSVDCFACFYNAKLPKFFSRCWNPGTAGVDAFGQNWGNENCLLVPLVALILSVLRHLHLCKGKGALVCPFWVSSSFWPLLWSCYRECIKGGFIVEGSQVLQLGRNSIFGSSSFRENIRVVYLDCL